jgi:hypothetical protein
MFQLFLFLFLFFRREKGNCKICWIPISASSDFQVSGKLFFSEIFILICRKKWKRSQGKMFGPKKLGGFGASP